MPLKTLYIYQDESGSLADVTDKVVIIALVTTLNPWALRFVTKKVYKKSLAKKGKKYKNRGHKEFKYSTAFKQERAEVLNILKQKQVDIFVLSIKKENKKIQDSPLNYGIALAEILKTLLKYYKKQSLDFKLILDKHYIQDRQIKQLDEIIEKALNRDLKPIHVDSKGNPFIALADFVAGALREKFFKNDDGLTSIIVEKIVFKQQIKWQDLKRKWFNKIKWH